MINHINYITSTVVFQIRTTMITTSIYVPNKSVHFPSSCSSPSCPQCHCPQHILTRRSRSATMVGEANELSLLQLYIILFGRERKEHSCFFSQSLLFSKYSTAADGFPVTDRMEFQWALTLQRKHLPSNTCGGPAACGACSSMNRITLFTEKFLSYFNVLQKMIIRKTPNFSAEIKMYWHCCC